MLISILSWHKNPYGEWKFESRKVSREREWEACNDTGYLVTGTEYRIDGYCIQGHEDEWKTRLIDECIKKCDKNIQSINKTKLMFLNILREDASSQNQRIKQNE